MAETNGSTWHSANGPSGEAVLEGWHSYRYQESSSWYEASSSCYRVLRQDHGKYGICLEKETFNNDGMTDAERDNYDGERDIILSPHSYVSEEAAKAACEHHFNTGEWPLIDDRAN